MSDIALFARFFRNPEEVAARVSQARQAEAENRGISWMDLRKEDPERSEELKQSLVETLDQPNPEQQTEKIKELLKQGADPATYTSLGTVPLHHAQIAEHTKLLLDRYAAPDLTDKLGRTPLHLARDADQVALLADAGAAFNALLPEDADPFFSVNEQDRHGNTPLHTAANPEVARALLDRGADPSMLNQQGRSAEDSDVMRHVRGADLARDLAREMNATYADEQSRRAGVTQEIQAEKQELYATLDMPNPDQQNEHLQQLLETQGLMPGAPIMENEGLEMTMDSSLHHAQTAEHTRMLLEHGAPVELLDTQGRTALHVAKDPAQVELLLDHGGDLSATDFKGNTPLHTASSPEVAQAMLDQGADPATLNQEGRRADDSNVVREARGQDLAKSMDSVLSSFTDVMTNLSSDDAAQMRAEAPVGSSDVRERIRTVGERMLPPDIPGAPTRRRL